MAIIYGGTDPRTAPQGTEDADIIYADQTTYEFFSQVDGRGGDDVIYGGNTGNALNGGDGNDTIEAAVGHFSGGNGDDILISKGNNPNQSAGNNLFGGEGNDLYVLYQGGQNTILNDFTSAEKIDLSNLPNADQLTLTTGAAAYGVWFESGSIFGNPGFTIKVNWDGTGTANLVFYTLDYSGIVPTLTADNFIFTQNTAPVASDLSISGSEDDASIDGAVTATDAEGDTLTYSVSGNTPEGLTFNSDGTFSYTPQPADQALNAGQIRDVTFQYIANDGTVDSAVQTVNITVKGADDQSIIYGGTDPRTAPQGTEGADIIYADQTTYEFFSQVDGRGGDDIIYGGNTDNALNGGDGNDTIEAAVGHFSGGNGDDILISKGNNPNRLAGNNLFGGEGNDLYVLYQGGQNTILNDFTSAEKIDLSNLPNASQLTLTTGAAAYGVWFESGSIFGNPGFTIRVNWDGTGTTNLVFYTLDYSGIVPTLTADNFILGTPSSNTAPVAFDLSISGSEDDASIDGAVSATDAEGDTLTYSVSGNTPNGLTFNSDGTFSYAPQEEADQALNAGESRDVTFQYVANDGMVDSAVQTVNITVHGADEVIVGTEDPDFLVGSESNDIISALAGDDVIISRGGNDTLDGGDGDDFIAGYEGNDTIFGGSGADTVSLNLSTDGADQINTFAAAADGIDTVYLLGASQIRLSFTSAEVGNSNTNDANMQANQDGGLAVRIQAEDASGVLTGDISRADDEGVRFEADKGSTLDVRDLVSGVARGDQFNVAVLGTNAEDVFDHSTDTRSYYINAGQGNDVAVGGSGNDFLVGGAGFDVLIGGDGDDRFIGGSGNDSLIGGAGTDTLTGGTGDDTYQVDDHFDTIQELTGEGQDTVLASVSHRLGAELEGLTLLGANLTGTGNVLANTLTAHQSGSQLFGGGGKDTLIGGMGNDLLDGGVNADRLEGGMGDDTYVVNLIGDVVVETENAGIDLVMSEINYTLGAHVENLTLSTAGLRGTGNVLNNTLTAHAGGSALLGAGGNDTLNGAAGNDILDGGIGIDLMAGGAGNDTYRVNTRGDQTIEMADGGVDVIESTVTWNMADQIEKLTLMGTANINGIGNSMDNSILGNSGNNTLDGRLGMNDLAGGAGDDSYVLARNYAQNTIMEDMNGGMDVVLLGKNIKADQMWFSQVGDDLQASVIGTSAAVVVKGWYSTGMSVETFRLSNGSELQANEVQALVDAMAGFTPPAMGNTELSAQYQTQFGALITSSWN